MTAAISVAGLTRRYGDLAALRDVTFEVAEGSITGLLGRNGAGKTTLMRIVAAQEFASAGRVQVFGVDPVENEDVLRRMVFIREGMAFPQFFRVHHALRAASWFYPNWSSELAEALIEDFSLPRDRLVQRLSKGMRSALGIVIGLAARGEVTMFDEPYAGLDAVARQLFYDHLLADCAERPRTVLLSTHLIDEVAGLLERAVVIDQGQLVLDAATDELRGTAVSVSGTAPTVAEFVAGRETWGLRQVASQATAVLIGQLGASDSERARTLGLHLEPVSLQQLVVHAVGGRSGSTQGGERR